MSKSLRGGLAFLVGIVLLTAAPDAKALTSDTVFIGHARGYSSVKALNINTGKEVPLIEFKTSSKVVAISPDERMLAWQHGSSVYLFDHATQKTSTLFTNKGEVSYSVAKFLPNGELLTIKHFSNNDEDATTRWQSEGGSFEYWKYSLKTGQHTRLAKKDSEWLWRATSSADGKYKLLFPDNPELGRGGEGSAIGGTKILLMSPTSTQQVVLSTGLGKTEPWWCSDASFSPKSNNAIFFCADPNNSYSSYYPLQVKKNSEGYRRSTGLPRQPAQWIFEDQFVDLTETGAVVNGVQTTSHIISVINWEDADPDLYKTIATSKDTSKISYQDVMVRGQKILYVENTISEKMITGSRLLRYDLSTGKTTVVLKSKPNERLSLQLSGRALYMFGSY